MEKQPETGGELAPCELPEKPNPLAPPPVVELPLAPRFVFASDVQLSVRDAAMMFLLTSWLTQVRVVDKTRAQVLRFGRREVWRLDEVLRSCFQRRSSLVYEPEKNLHSGCPGFSRFAGGLGRAKANFAKTMVGTTVEQLLDFVLRWLVNGGAPRSLSFGCAQTPDRIKRLYEACVVAELKAGTFALLGWSEELRCSVGGIGDVRTNDCQG